MRFQKGQSIVEFAIVLPFFLVVLWGIFYGSFLFTDYLSLTNLARSTAREASIEASGLADDKRQAKYDEVLVDVADDYKSPLKTDLYTFDPMTDMTIAPVYENDVIKNVKVTIKAKLNKEDILGRTFKGFFSVADEFEIEYQMYQEK